MKLSKDLEIVYEKTEEVVERKIGTATILVPLRPKDLQKQSIFYLEGIGGEIWQLINGQRNVKQIFEALLQEFEAERSQLLTDLLEFFEQLKAIGGIRNVNMS